MKPGDRLICLFVNPPIVGRNVRFKEWPLHVTIVPWFRLGTSHDELALELENTLLDLTQFEAVAGPNAGFGHNKSKVVSLVEPSPKFAEIEKRVRQTLKKHNAWLVD